MDKRTFLVFLAALLAALVFASVAVNAEEEYSMFTNDTPWYEQHRLPLESIYGVDYIPLSMLAQITGVSIRENTTLRNVLVSYGDKYITFDLSKSIMYTSDGQQHQISTYLLYGSERYVPAKTVCEYLSLEYERHGDIVRITDGNERLSLHQLLVKYNPSIVETVVDLPTTDSESESESNFETDINENINKAVYLSFICDADTDGVISTLDAFSLKALFFADYNYISNNIDTVRRLVAKGHSIAIYADGSAGVSAFFESISDSQDILCKYFKFKTRLISCFNAENKLISSADFSSGLSSSGYAYVTRGKSFDNRSSVNAAAFITSSLNYVNKNEVAYLLYECDELTLRSLPGIIGGINRNQHSEYYHISDSNIPLF